MTEALLEHVLIRCEQSLVKILILPVFFFETDKISFFKIILFLVRFYKLETDEKNLRLGPKLTVSKISTFFVLLL